MSDEISFCYEARSDQKIHINIKILFLIWKIVWKLMLPGEFNEGKHCRVIYSVPIAVHTPWELTFS